jgi:hypothetical protein
MAKIAFVRKISKQAKRYVITVPPDAAKVLKHRGVYQVELTPLKEEGE